MKILIIAGLCILGSSIFFFGDWQWKGVVYAQNAASAEDVLKKVSGKLNGLRSLKYKYQLELNYASEGYRATVAADAFLDFTSVDKIVGLKYQFGTADELHVFNGSERFVLNRKNKTITIDQKPASEYFKSVTFLYNSPATFRNVLRDIVADATIPKSITETTVNDRPHYVVEFVLDKKTLGRLGGYERMQLDRKTTYWLTIDKGTYLPVEVLQKNNANQDYMKAAFTETEANGASPDQLSWYYSSYLSDYKRSDSAAATNSLIPVGASAPQWSLPVYGRGNEISLSQFRNKVVLLQFWISHCGFSIAAVPKLNALTDKYKDRPVKILAVNVHDSAEIINLFVEAHKPKYDILSGGEEVTKTYGVDGFPTIVLIDKTGKVIYSGGLDEKHLEDLIEKSIR